MTTPPVPSITDDMIAELEEAARGRMTEPYVSESEQGECGLYIALITRLREAERDAARYRWLREYENDCFMLNTLQVASMEDLDVAIDAAMKGDL